MSDGGLYKLLSAIPSSQANSVQLSLFHWHAPLGHCDLNKIQLSIFSSQIDCSSNSNNYSFSCSSWLQGKLTKFPLPPIEYKTSAPLQLIHTDVWGLSPHVSISSQKYFFLFVDDFTWFTWFYPLVQHNDIHNVFVLFQKFVETQFICKIKAIQIDEGGEYRRLHVCLVQQGI